MNLFTGYIGSWSDWGRIFQSISAFAPLVEYIIKKESLPLARIENLTPGTNAVFKAGDYVVKIYAPAESGMDQTSDMKTEIFAAKRANQLGIASPRVIAAGSVEDKYRFAYMITEYICGREFCAAEGGMTDHEKYAFGRRLRTMTDKMNVPCQPFNDIDIKNDRGRSRRWDKYPESFKSERRAYIASHSFGENVFVHGDLCGDNILLAPGGKLYIIDFADAVLAPVIYEQALVAAELFDFDKHFIRGYFGDCGADRLTDLCFNGLLIHDFGGDIVKAHLGEPSEFKRIDDLRLRIKERLIF